MHYSFDFGASTTDMIVWEGKQIKKIQSFESLDLKSANLKQFFQDIKIEPRKAERIFITGGRSRFFEDKISGVPVIKVNEIEAIGRGGYYTYAQANKRPCARITCRMSHVACSHVSLQPTTYNLQPLLVVSMGTGTCLVKSQKLKFKGKSCNKVPLTTNSLSGEVPQHGTKTDQLLTTHLGGTGVGGGTFLGLTKEILGETDIDKLIAMFRKGDRRKVDLSVGEIVGGGIGIVSPNVTASNLGKLAREIDFSKADLAAGIANLIGQTIATAAIFAARAEKIKTIVLAGKLTRIQKITEIIFEVGELYGMKVVLPKNAEYVSAVGAGIN